MRRPLRVGHKGADAIVPGNTRESFDAALAAGVDMLEFDVLWTRRGEPLLLAHDLADAERPDVLGLDDGLAHLARPEFAGIRLDVDLKAPGYEAEVVDALRRHDLVDRTLVSSQYPASLDAVGRLEPAIRRGWSVPRVRRDYTASPITLLPALGLLEVLKRRLPGQAAAEIGRGRFQALMAYWRLVTPRLVRGVDEAGGEVYAWTVDDAAAIRRLTAMGVHAVITNDPRLFDAVPAPA